MSKLPRFKTILVPIVGLMLLTGSAWGAQVVADSGGTGDLTHGYGYTPCKDLMHIIDGLPPGTTIDIDPILVILAGGEGPGGTLGGTVLSTNSQLSMNMAGTGGLAGYNRFLAIPVQSEIHTGPRTPGLPLQSFPTDMFQLQGQLPIGDPDFDLLRITAGTGFGMPSPGHTTLTQQPGGTWAIDSFFDITYRIDFIGRPGGSLGGHSGSTTGTIRMSTVPCPTIPLPSAAFMGIGLLSSLGLARRRFVCA